MNDTKGTRFMRGLVKTVFIGCYAAFLWASIHHVAAFFDNYEQSGNNTFGSFMLAGAIDITALVTTIGVMFFRKSMPRFALVILWIFIGALALYSWLINWEYAAHFQSNTLLLQPTGATTAVYDAQGNLHYVPVMQLNTWLLYINPALASCFTIFALVYSVVGEFFGAKAPTAEELQSKLDYLESIDAVQQKISKLEEKGRKPSIIQRAKQSALEIKDAVKEVAKKETIDSETASHSTQEPEGKPERITDELEVVSDQNVENNQNESSGNGRGNRELTPEESSVASYYEKTLSWITDGRPTVPLKVVSETMNQSMKLLHNRVASRQIQATKNKEIVRKSSVIAWAIREVIPIESQKTVKMKAVPIAPENKQANTGDLDMIERAMLRTIQKASPEIQAELTTLAQTKPLEEVIDNLRKRYPEYAHYFTSERVSRVVAAMEIEQSVAVQ